MRGEEEKEEPSSKNNRPDLDSNLFNSVSINSLESDCDILFCEEKELTLPPLQPKRYRVILRTRKGIEDRRFCGHGNEPIRWFKMIHPEFTTLNTLTPVLSFKSWDKIVKYDEHTLNNKYKFGIIYQKGAQITEDELLSNNNHSEAFNEFLDCLGDKVKLKGFEDYSGGLDTKHDLTGKESVFTKFEERQVMFHVSTMLPNSEHDDQQLARKRHIGNDICVIIFQEEPTPFIPGTISSQFLHCYIVVQGVDTGTDNCRYKVSIACRDDVQDFPPRLPNPCATFRKGPEFRSFILTKLINAERSAYRAKKFNKLNARTRCLLLDGLYSELKEFADDEIVCQGRSYSSDQMEEWPRKDETDVKMAGTHETCEKMTLSGSKSPNSGSKSPNGGLEHDYGFLSDSSDGRRSRSSRRVVKTKKPRARSTPRLRTFESEELSPGFSVKKKGKNRVADFLNRIVSTPDAKGEKFLRADKLSKKVEHGVRISEVKPNNDFSLKNGDLCKNSDFSRCEVLTEKSSEMESENSPLVCEKLCKNLQKLENSGNLITSVNIEDVMVEESRSRLIKPIITRSEINQKFRHSMTHVDPRHLRNRLLKLWCFELQELFFVFVFRFL